ncbi:MAG: 7-alpha-hydroxysteroid dehydrogenase [Parvularcula sp.]|jgi:7-alpha-hydroxysteroid dehydrogenase|nr:7-alpha-hydroxysteroid dehydrogenase [Parvularcula sp.]
MYNAEDFTMAGEVVVVTGAGAGIGRGIAETFAAAGACVMVSDYDADTANDVADQLTAQGFSASSVKCDVTDEGDLTALIERTVEQFDKLTCLVSNAGGGGPKPFDMPMADFRHAYDLNVFSLFRLAQLAAPQMDKSGGGSILAITSMAGENTNRNMASYSSSKAATNHLIRNIAFDLGPKNIRVNGIAPGATRTDALASVLDDKTEKAMLAHTPIHRLGEVQDMANAALFLCSPAASWISGQILTVSDGGVQELS